MLQKCCQKKSLSLGLALVLVLSIAIRWFWVDPHGNIGKTRVFKNAAWIGVDWVSHPPDERKVMALSEAAREREIDYLYVFTTYVKPDGTFSPSYQHAGEFVRLFHKTDNSTKLLVWIGVPVRPRRSLAPPGWVDLSREDIRRQIVLFVVKLVEEAGFDGVHLDVEHVDDGDCMYLALLREMKKALGPGKILSVAGNDWLPDLLNRMPVFGGYKWGSKYYGRVASEVDQIAVMTYDSFSPWAWVYRWWLREQVIGISCSVREPGKLLIGISVSRESTRTHRPGAENMESGLAGVVAGLNSSRCCCRSVRGIAIYAWWEAREEDWQVWREQWLSAD